MLLHGEKAYGMRPASQAAGRPACQPANQRAIQPAMPCHAIHSSQPASHRPTFGQGEEINTTDRKSYAQRDRDRASVFRIAWISDGGGDLVPPVCPMRRPQLVRTLCRAAGWGRRRGQHQCLRSHLCLRARGEGSTSRYTRRSSASIPTQLPHTRFRHARASRFPARFFRCTFFLKTVVRVVPALGADKCPFLCGSLGILFRSILSDFGSHLIRI